MVVELPVVFIPYSHQYIETIVVSCTRWPKNSKNPPESGHPYFLAKNSVAMEGTYGFPCPLVSLLEPVMESWIISNWAYGACCFYYMLNGVCTGWWTFCRLTSCLVPLGTAWNSWTAYSFGRLLRQFCLETNLSCWNFSTQPQDRLCIAQHDMALKEQGIRGLGCFLSKSRNLTILWSGRYFSRLWLIICWASLGCEWNWFVTVFWRLHFGKKGIRVTFPVQFMSKSCRGYEYICTSVSFFFQTSA